MSSVDSPPKPRDVTDFRFKSLRKVRISDGFLEVPQDRSANLLVVSNKYGVVFAATQNDIRILRTVDIERLDEDKLLYRTDASEYPSARLQLRERPWHLGLGCDDLTLSVCVLRDSCPVAELYDVRCLADKGRDVEPFTCIRLSSMSGVEVVDFKWNPEVSNMFAVCLSDGSVCTWSVEAGSIKICGSIASLHIAATAISWSPKGKQLVVGRMDGSLVQYLPNLQEAKTVPAPTIFASGVAVVNVTWLSSFQFAVTYLIDGRPCLVLVTSQKAKPCSYVNFDEICYSTSDSRRPQYYVVHLAEWGLFMCSSSNSVEVSLLAKPSSASLNWEQWMLEDSGRAELPLVSNDETYPLGMAVDFTSQRQIPINDTDIISAKPIVYILSTGGILCSFYAISDRVGDVNLQKAPMELAFEGVQKSSVKTKEPAVMPKPQEVSTNSSSDANRILTPASQSSFASIVSGKPASLGSGSIISGTPVSGSNVKSELWKTPSIVPSASATAAAARALSSQTLVATHEVDQKSHSTNATLPASTLSHQSVVTSTPKTSPQKSLSATKKSAPAQNVLMAAIKEEIRRFGAEVLSQKKSSSIELKMDDAELKSIAAGVQSISAFVNEAKKATKSLNLDVHNLRGRALETYGSVEEAISLERRTKDKQFVKLLRTRGLDPLSVKKMRDVRTLAYYLEQQMHDVHAVLDRQWDEHEALRERRALAKSTKDVGRRTRVSIVDDADGDLPKIEMIYKTVSANLNAMYLLEQQIDGMAGRLSKIDGFKRHSSKPLPPVAVQHETIWSVGKRRSDAPSNTIGAFSPQQTSPNRMSLLNFSGLRSVLEKRRVTHIRPPSPSENEFSRLLSPGLQMWNVDVDRNGDKTNGEEASDADLSSTFHGVPDRTHEKLTRPSTAACAPAVAMIARQSPSIFSVAAYSSSKGGGRAPFEVNIGGLTLGTTKIDEPKVLEEVVSPKIKPPPLTTSIAASSFSFVGSNHGFNFSKFTAASSFDSSMFKVNSAIGGSIFGTSVSANKSPITEISTSVSNHFTVTAKSTDSKPVLPSVIASCEDDDDDGRDEHFAAEELEAREDEDDDDDGDEDDDENEEEEDEDEDDEEEEDDDDDEEEYADKDGEEDEDAELLISQDGGETTPISLPQAESTSTSAVVGVPQMTSSISPSDVAKPAPVLASLIAGKSSLDITIPVHNTSIFGTPTAASQPVAFSQSAGSGFTALFGSATTTTTAATTATLTATITTPPLSPSTFRFVSPESASSTSPSSTSQSKLPTFSFTLPATVGKNVSTTTSTTTTSIFGQVVQQASVAPATPVTITGAVTATSGGSIFGSQSPPPPPTESTSNPPFGSKFSFVAPPGVTQTSTPSIFGGKPMFGAQQASTSPTSSSSSSTSATAQTFFGQSSSSAFSSNQAPGFGEQVAKVGFGQPTSPVFGQTQTSFGGGGSGGSIFGQAAGSGTGFFSGLGGKPNPANANRNIFGGSATFGDSSVSAQNTTLFGGGATNSGSMWSKPAGTGGSFKSDTTVGGVGQTGFGGFQQSPTRTGGFGGGASFSSTPSFGITPAFGGAPSFGGINPVGGRVFGSPSPVAVAQDATGFGSIAASTGDAPSFGALATSATMGFNSVVGQQGAVNEVVAGTPPSLFGVQCPAFGIGSGGNVFGGAGNQPSTANQGGFGNPGSSPSFSQWRS